MRNKILSSLVGSFSKDFCIGDLEDFKRFEYFSLYLSLARYDPDFCDDIDDIKCFDVDSSGTYGLDSIFFYVNNNIVRTIDEVRALLSSKSLDVKVVISQVKTSESLDSGEFLKFTSAVKMFLGGAGGEGELKWARELYDFLFSDECAVHFNYSGPVCELHYVYAGKRQGDGDTFSIVVSQQRAEIETLVPDMRGGISIAIDDSEFLIDSYNEIKNKFTVDIDLKNNVPLEDIDGVEKAYLAYVGVDDFLPLITGPDGRIRGHVFYENVRDFQGDNPVNNEIKGSILDEASHDKFVILNNGITIIAREMSQLRGKRFRISKYFIVNGCQTSHVIFNNKNNLNNANDFFIPIKIIHTQSSELISRVIRATNKQTSIPDEAFAALENFHKRLQQFYEAKSQELSEKLAYERRLKELLQDDVVGYKVISLHRQIRAWVAVIEGAPWTAVKDNPSGMFKSRAGKIFLETHAFDAYYFSAYLVTKFYDFQSANIFSERYALFRYHIAYVFMRVLMGQAEVPYQGAAAKKFYERLEGRVKDKAKFEALYIQTAKLIIERAGQFKSGKTISLTEISRNKSFFDGLKAELVSGLSAAQAGVEA